jgi:hypothetical protein
MTLLRWYVPKSFWGNSIPARPTSLQKGNVVIDIFDSEKIVGKRLSTKAVVAISEYEHGGVIYAIQREMAMKLSDAIMKDSAFFKSEIDKLSRMPMVTYQADVVVLTQDEYKHIQEEAFKKGLHHAYGFMPISPHPSQDKSDQRIAP